MHDRNDDHDWKPESLAAQALGWIDPATGAVGPAIQPSTTFERGGDNSYPFSRVYSRPDSPAYDQAESLLARLEGGAEAMLFASGMAAATAVFQALAPGDHVIIPKVMYWSLRNWIVGFAERWGLGCDIVDMAEPAAVEAALRPGTTRLVWIETPSNPLWTVSDIARISHAARLAGARVCVDSTVATPVLTRPLALGADLVMHSATKYLNGHSDVVAGALVTAKADEHWGALKRVRNSIGGVLGPFEAWLLLRGMRTLYPRVQHASRSAMEIATRLSEHPRVIETLYPGLPDHRGHALAARQMSGGFGGMLSIRVGGGQAAAIGVAARVRLWKRATSLGGVESLIEHRASIEGPTSPVPGDLLRLSVGLEAVDDLVADLEQALDGA
jgi:cystathionine gamma-synthase